MSKLRNQMMQDLDLGGYSPKTKKTYVESIVIFARFHGRSPDKLGQREVRAWAEHLCKQRPKLSPQRLRQHFAALRFFDGKTLGRPDVTAFLSWLSALTRMGPRFLRSIPPWGSVA